MHDRPDHDPDRTQRLDDAALRYFQAREAGQAPTRDEWLARYPELAEELADFLAGHDQVEQLAAPLQALRPSLVNDPDTTIAFGGQGWEGEVPLSVSSIVGGYELLEELGRGGMGVVYKARQVKANRVVALKMILAQAHATLEEKVRFQIEAEAVASLAHPHIVQLHEVGENAGLPYFSLEYCEGGAFDRRLASGPLPVREAAELTEKLARAMHYAHLRGVVHRDLKPANVLFTLDGEPKVTDFGLAKTAGAADHTATGVIMGTASYMAPEQASGRTREAGPAADVWALGAILYECLTGHPPFKEESPWATMQMVIGTEPEPPRRRRPETPRDLETICLKCLQKDARQRYASAEKLADDLRHYLADEPIAARPIGSAERLWRWCRRHKSRALAAGVALFALIVMLVGGVWFNSRLRAQLHLTEEAEQKLQMRLLQQAAERLDGELQRLATIPRLMAATLAERTDWTQAQLETWMRDVLKQNPRVYGTCVAFEPFQFDGREDFALYVYRPPAGLTTKVLVPPVYTPLYREWTWYSQTAKERRAVWTEPFVDYGAGDIPLLSPSIPLERKGKFVGVVTVDLSLDYFQVLRQWLDELRLGETGYAFVVSPKGTFISHPDPTCQLPRRITEVPEFQNDDNLRDLTRRMLEQETGRVIAVDPFTGKLSTFLFTPVRSTRWSLVVVVGN
jgi:tRNA A-37 threonylcarbamoyl transferase component Bud32